MFVEMKVKFLTFDSTSNGFVVLLMDMANKTGLPIWGTCAGMILLAQRATDLEALKGHSPRS